MIQRLFSTQSKTITGAAILLGGASFASRIIGMFRDRLFAHLFGAGDTLDAYYAAFRIPDFIYNLLIVGAISAGFIPVFIALREKDVDDAWRLTSAVMNILVLALFILSFILFVLAPQLTISLVPGFSEEKIRLTITLTRIMLVGPLLLGMSSIVSGVLQSFRAFIVYALAPIMYNIGIIIGALVFYPLWGVVGLGYGVILGAVLHLGIQLPAFFRYGFRYTPAFLLKSRDLRAIGKQILPRTMGLAASQINLVIITILASTLSSGSIAVFNFANNLQYIPVGIVGISFAIAAYPTLALATAQKNLPKFIEEFSHTMRQILFFALPGTIILLLLRAQLVRIVLGSGSFDWDATIRTADALRLFSLSLFAQCLIPLFARAWYALHDTWTPFVISILSEGVTLVGSLLLRDTLGVAGLALAFSLATIFQCSLLGLLLRRRVGSIEERILVKFLIKISAAAVSMAIVMQYAKMALSLVVDMTRFWGIFAQGTIAGALGLLVYLGICALLNIPEFDHMKQSIQRRWMKPIAREIVDGDHG